ncbi:DUF6036 family nucleotidyltransferase [Curtobacterium sp. MCBD17_040]|uniref:DUF6036 family nucleotidyltransferase n=1 Tax=Curtobacterium sp. MCBD17_040 TaxID=2175674 RepID=UPI000DA89158|nr:DUF6036 family nucleotidyltransferase [Curtobacterium sp. MCBD17_040]WIB65530.1 hypothetical protein DEI94_19340 [Curtobacterium sp. MCBD17_040]
MKRADLDLAIQRACEIVRQSNVYIIGSQSILGTYGEEDLPELVTLSDEVDIAPVADDPNEIVADLLDGQLGEMSQFHQDNGFYIQGVGKRTANLPSGWMKRLVPVKPPGAPGTTGLCLDPHDLCAAKLVANRPKDITFVNALLDADLIDGKILRARVDMLDPNGVSGSGIPLARRRAIESVNRQNSRRAAG